MNDKIQMMIEARLDNDYPQFKKLFNDYMLEAIEQRLRAIAALPPEDDDDDYTPEEWARIDAKIREKFPFAGLLHDDDEADE